MYSSKTLNNLYGDKVIPEVAYHTWVRLWGAALVFQTLSTYWWAQAIYLQTWVPLAAVSEPAVLILGLLLIRFPASRFVLIMACSAHLFNFYLLLPAVPNHRLLSAIVNLTLLVALLMEIRGTTSALYLRICKALRPSVIAFYLLAAAHKMNADFLLSESSCGIEITRGILSAFNISAVYSNPIPWAIATICIEVCIPVLLLSRFGVAGVFMGFIFHFALSCHPTRHFLDFSSVMLALLSLFSVPHIPTVFHSRLCFSPVWAGFIASALVFGLLADTAAGQALYQVFVFCAWGLLCAWYLRVYIAPAMRMETPSLPKVAPGILWVLPLTLTILNGVTPYVGLKTKTSWDMYSNLVTEGGVSNHLFIPVFASLRPDWIDLVQVIESTAPALAGLAADGSKLTRLELTRFKIQNPSEHISYLWGGAKWAWKPHQPPPDGFSPPLWQLKLLWSHVIPRDGVLKCQQ